MARTVTYEQYLASPYGVVVPEEDWPRFAAAASQRLDYLKAMCRVTPVGDADTCEVNAVCAIADVLYDYERAQAVDATGITSERVGSVSMTYSGTAERFPRGLELSVSNAVAPWLHVCRVVG